MQILVFDFWLLYRRAEGLEKTPWYFNMLPAVQLLSLRFFRPPTRGFYGGCNCVTNIFLFIAVFQIQLYSIGCWARFLN